MKFMFPFAFLLFIMVITQSESFYMPNRRASSRFVKRLISRTAVNKNPADEKKNDAFNHHGEVPKMIRQHIGAHFTLIETSNEPDVPSDSFSKNGSNTGYDQNDHINPALEDFDLLPDENKRLKHGNCKSGTIPGRSIAIISDYHGAKDGMLYIDNHSSFFRLAMGFSKTQVEESRDSALQHFNNEFSIDFDISKATYDKGKYMIAAMGMTFAPVVYDSTFKVVADSHTSTPCLDITGVIGAWVLEQENMTVHGVQYTGKVSLMNMFFVFHPGTRHVTRLSLYPTIPTNCAPDMACTLSGWTYNFDYPGFGWIDAMSISGPTPNYGYSSTFRAVATWSDFTLPKVHDEEISI